MDPPERPLQTRARGFASFALLAILISGAGQSASAQNQVATHDVWALEYVGNTIHIFDASGIEIGPTIPLAGTGSARGIAFNDSGLAYVARGQDVRTYNTTTTTVFADASDGIDQAQDVAVRPGTSQEVWVAAGTSATNSKIIKFSSTGTVIQTLTSPSIDHPRRIVWNSAGTKLFVASVNNKKIFTVNPTSGAFTQLADLTSQGIIPIGLAYDVTRDAVWVVGDFGANGKIGFVNGTTGAYTNLLNEGQFPSLTSPTNVFFDRFRVLQVAARNLNGGLPGIYRFDASSGASLTFLGKIGASLTSVMDVAPRPEIIGIGAPVSANAFVLHASLTGPVSNTITFSAPRVPNAPYLAALSPRWQPSCTPYVPGILEPALRLPFPDARGVPLSLSDGGFLLGQTAAICCFPATPFPTNTMLLISGFIGMLNGSGQATALIDFLPAAPFLNGVELSLAFVTIDFAIPSLFGRISDPICLTIAVGP